MEGEELWRWVWLAVAVAGIAGEILTAGTFFLLPFGIGAAVACLLAFVDVGLALQWVAFVAVAAAGVAATRPLARRLDRTVPPAVAGARRLIGKTATVLTDLRGDEPGVVRVEGEEWRACTQGDVAIPAGSRVLVVEVTGTRLEVLPLELQEGGH